jgi:hypothetical protein
MTGPTTEELRSALLGVEEDCRVAVADELDGILEELDALRDALRSTTLGELHARLTGVRAIVTGTLPTAVRDVVAALILHDEAVREAVESR